MTRVLFLNRRFEAGGAERQLIELLKRLDRSRFEIFATPFYSGGEFWDEVTSIANIVLIPLNKKHRWDIYFLMTLVRQLKKIRPNVIHGYMGVANIFALLGRLVGARVVWAIRASDMHWAKHGWLFRVSWWMESCLARYADLIICNSLAGLEHAAKHGFPKNKMIVIPNGIDTDRFYPDKAARESVRGNWGITDTQILIGIVARLDPMKDHTNFLRAAAIVAQRSPDAYFVCVGDGPEAYQRKLQALSHELGLNQRLIWVGAQSNMAAVYNGLDLMVLSSAYGEGFPNVIGEAMACGIACVVTNVGDSAAIVVARGRVVEPRNPEALANSILGNLVDCHGRPHTRGDLSKKCRERIQQHYSLQALIRSTEAALG